MRSIKRKTHMEKERKIRSEEKIKPTEYKKTVEIENENEIEDNSEYESIIPPKSKVGAPLKVQFRSEVAKLKEMPSKKKVEYIWEYYKIPIIVIIVGLFLIGSLINSIFINPPARAAVFISWNAGFVLEEQLSEISAILEEGIVKEKDNEIVEIVRSLEGDDPTFNMANVQRQMAMMAAGIIDIFTLNTEMLENYSSIGHLEPLDEILVEIRSRNPAIYNIIEENTVYALHSTGAEDSELTERIMGVSIGSCPLFKEVGIFEQEIYFAVSVTSGNKENVIRTLIMLFE